jgi:DNA-binding protein Fis
MKSNYFIATLPEGHDTTLGLRQLEAEYIEHVYELARYNQSKAALMLGLSRGNLRHKLKQYFGDKYL